MTYWNHVAGLVMDACEADTPTDASIVDIWDDDCPEDIDADRFVVGAMTEWSDGFLRAFEAWPDKWGGVQQKPELAEPLALIRAYAEFLAPGNQEKISASIDAGRSLDGAVLAIARAARPELR